MWRIFITFIFLLPSTASIIAAYLLAVKGVSGWGWFLVIAVLLGASGISYAPSIWKKTKNEIGD
jgi:hypothetical protein